MCNKLGYWWLRLRDSFSVLCSAIIQSLQGYSKMHVSDYLSKVTQPEAPLTPLTTQVPGGSSSASFAVLKTLMSKLESSTVWWLGLGWHYPHSRSQSSEGKYRSNIASRHDLLNSQMNWDDIIMTKVWSHGSCWKIETRVSRGGAWCGGWGGLSGRRRGRRSRTWRASPRCASSCAGWARHCGRTSSRSPASCTRRASPPCGCGCGPAQRTQVRICQPQLVRGG